MSARSTHVHTLVMPTYIQYRLTVVLSNTDYLLLSIVSQQKAGHNFVITIFFLY